MIVLLQYHRMERKQGVRVQALKWTRQTKVGGKCSLPFFAHACVDCYHQWNCVPPKRPLRPAVSIDEATDDETMNAHPKPAQSGRRVSRAADSPAGKLLGAVQHKQINKEQGDSINSSE